MKRFFSLFSVVLLVSVLVLPACGDPSDPYIPPEDTSETEASVVDVGADIGIEIDQLEEPDEVSLADETSEPDELIEPDELVEPDEVTPCDPLVTFCLATAGGCADSEGDLSLTMDDDQNAEATGLQTTVTVTTECIPVGTELVLIVDGIEMDSLSLPMEQFSFKEISLSHKPEPPCHVVEVNAKGFTFEDATVCVTTGNCGITLEPSNDGCQSEDANLVSPGFQVQFKVGSDGTDCDEAWVEVTGDENPAEHAAIGEDGTVDIEVTMSEVAGEQVCLVQGVTAHVGDSNAPEREASLGPLDFTIDSSGPLASITGPVGDSVNLLSDEDAELDGIQVELTGEVVDLGAEGLVEIYVDDVLQGLADVDGSQFTYLLTFAEQGQYLIEARATDCCLKTGADFKSLTVIFAEWDLLIQAPESGDILYSKADGNSDTALVFEMAFSVFAPACQVDDEIIIRCKEADSSLEDVGTFTLTEVAADWVYSIDVALDTVKIGNETLCRAYVDKQPPAKSEQIGLTIALPAPKLIIDAPSQGDILEPGSIEVSGQAVNLSGQQITVSLLGDENYDWNIFADGSGFYLDTSVDAGAEGAYTLSAEAQDQYGNLASEQEGSVTEIDIVLDASAPDLTFVFPEDGSVCTPPACVDAIAEEVMPGHQIEVQIAVTGESAPETVMVCLTANGNPVKPCGAPVATGDQHIAKFIGVTLVPGVNILSAYGTDLLGHMSDQAVSGVTLDVMAPRVLFIVPPADLVTAAEPVQIIGSVTSPDGLTAYDDAEVSLLVQDVVFDTVTVGSAGKYEFALTGLTPNEATSLQLQAKQADYGETMGYSDTRFVTLKDVAPMIQIDSPADGTTFNSASAICTLGIAGCQLDIVGLTENVEDGQMATLEIACSDSEPVAVQAAALDDVVIWESVTLPDNSSCTLIAQAEDLVGQQTSSGAIAVVIDRTPPEVIEFVLPENALVPAELDKEAGTDTFEYEIVARISGAEAGNEVSLLIEPEDGEADTLVVELDEDIPDTVKKLLYFSQYSFVPGVNQLTVTVADNAGNPAVLGKQFQFITDPLDVQLYQFEWLEYKVCMSNADCGAGVCSPTSDGLRCVLPWNSSSQALTVDTKPVALFQGESNLRICSDHGGLTSEACAYSGTEGTFRIVAVADHNGGYEGISLSKAEIDALPQGIHNIIIEAKRSDTGEWVSSMNSSSDKTRSRTVLVDTEAPIVLEIGFADDAMPSDGWLNKGEAVSGNTFTVAGDVSGAEYGVATVSINTVKQAPYEYGDTAGTFQQDLGLFQGYNEVCVQAKDLVDNKSNTLCAEINVDTFSPSLTFTYPQAVDKLLVDSSADVLLKTEPQLEVDLDSDHDGDVSSFSKAADGQGNVVFDDVLAADGSHTLSASVEDAAGNKTLAQPTPDTVLVDRTAPTASVTAPTEGAAFGEGDDADPATGGFQLVVQFDSTDTQDWQIKTVRCLDAQYTQCETPVVKAPTNVQDLGNGTYAGTITVGKLITSPEYRTITVDVEDENGNTATDSVHVTIQPGACVLAITSLPETAFINNELCPVAGEDCQSTDVDVSISFAGACSGASQIVLYVNDMPEYSSSDLDTGSVSFSHQVTDGDQVSFEAKLMDSEGAPLETDGPIAFTVDLSDPIMTVTSPEAEPFICNVAVDENQGVDGCQFSADVEVGGDNLVGGAVTLLRVAGDTEYELDSAEIDAGPFSHTFAGATLPEVASQSLLFQASDAAGNQTELSLDTLVDVTPPSAVALNDIDPDTDVNRRRPSVRLTWTAVGDDGKEGGAASSYQFRYSRTPIDTEDDFDDACDPEDIASTGAGPTPDSPGSLESFDISGPDTRAPTDPCRLVIGTEAGTYYYFAARAVDDAGNISAWDVDATASTDELTLSYATVDTTGTGGASLGSWVFSVGDLNGDKMSEMVVAGDTTLSGFCIIRGHTDLADEIDISDPANPNVKCITDGYKSWQGFKVAGLGDVNGDGYGDVGSLVYVNAQLEDNSHLKVYLGNSAGFVDDTAAVTFTFGANDYWLSAIQGAGNFNGDLTGGGKPLNDIIIGTPELNKAFVIPGAAVWKTAAPVTIDLLTPADLSTWSVVEIEGFGFPADDRFGGTVLGVGNVLTDEGGAGQQYDDVAIARTRGESAVYVIKGRSLDQIPGMKLTISPTLDDSGTGDATTVRLRPDGATAGSWYFGNELAGNVDIDGDGIGDLGCAHHDTNDPNSAQLYVFYGAALSANLGTTLRLLALPVGGDVFVSDSGLRIAGPYSLMSFAGNFDNAASGPGLSVDLVYSDLNSAATFGHIYLRLNHQELAVDGNLYPYTDLIIEDPISPGNVNFAGWNMVSVGDVNGDGLPDLFAGSKNDGYNVLIY